MGAVDISEKQIKDIEEQMFVAIMNNLSGCLQDVIDSVKDYQKGIREVGRLLIDGSFVHMVEKIQNLLGQSQCAFGAVETMSAFIDQLQKNIEEMDKQGEAEARKVHEDEGRQSMAFAMEGPGPDGE